MDRPPTFVESAGQYAITLGKWGWSVIVGGILGDLVAFCLAIWAWVHASTPDGALGSVLWILMAIIITAMAVLPVVPFHLQAVRNWHETQKIKKGFEQRDSKSLEVVSGLKDHYKEVISARDILVGQLQSENAKLRDDHDYRNALQIALVS